MEETLDIEILKKLGKLTREIRKEVSKIPKEGVDITEIIDYVEKRIFDEGYLPAFPCTVSINEVAAHYTVFDEGYILKNGDLIKIDFGISENGFCTDNAFTVEIGTQKYKDLMETNKKALDKAMEMINYGVKMGDIGTQIHKLTTEAGFDTIHNLTGHQIGRYKLHAGLSVPNYNNHSEAEVKDNMQFAIEPFLTAGEPKVKSSGPSNILHLIRDKPIRDPIAKKVLMYIKEKYPRLPFSKRWLLDSFDKRKVLYALKLLKAHNIIYEYDALATVDGSFVSQFEDCVVFVNNEKTIITRL